MADADYGDVADVTHSTAFLTLDALVEQRKVVEERANYLKEKYKQLHDRVLTIYQNDNFLLKRAKAIRKELDVEKAKVEKCGEVAKEDDATIQKLKRELAVAENELSVAQEKESMLQVETIELERKKSSLQNEVDEAIAEEESRMRPHIDAITKAISELKDEIERTADNFAKYKQEREEAIKRDRETREKMDEGDNEIYQLKLDLTKLDREPDRAKKQADIVEKATQTAHKELSTLMDKLRLLNNTIKDHEERRKNMEEQRYELALTLETQRLAIEQREKMMDAIERNLESEKVCVCVCVCVLGFQALLSLCMRSEYATCNTYDLSKLSLGMGLRLGNDHRLLGRLTKTKEGRQIQTAFRPYKRCLVQFGCTLRLAEIEASAKWFLTSMEVFMRVRGEKLRSHADPNRTRASTNPPNPMNVEAQLAPSSLK